MRVSNYFSRKSILMRIFILAVFSLLIILKLDFIVLAQETIAEAVPEAVPAEAVISSAEENGLISSGDRKLVSINFKDTDIREVLNILAYKGGLNIVAGDDVVAKVSVQLKDVPWDHALDVILKTYNFTHKKEGNLIRVMSLSRAMEEESKVPLATKILSLNFSSVAELSTSLTKMLSKRGEIQVDKRTNSLIVTDVPSKVMEIEEAALLLDTRTPQVLIEAMMIDVKVTDDFDWGSVLTRLTDNKSQNNGNYYNSSLSANVSSDFNFNLFSDRLDLTGYIEFLVVQQRAQILANPKVLTLDNQEAKIEILEEIPYTETVDTGGGATTNVKFKTAGIKLYVTPHITSGHFISMNIKPEQSFKSSEVNNQPVIDSRRAETNLLVKDGETIVIGGLRRSTDNTSLEKVPFFGDIPIIGLLFQKKAITKVETELMLFVTPHIIIDPVMTDREMEMFEKLDKTAHVVLDTRTEMDKFRVVMNRMKERFKAEKIAESEEERIRRIRMKLKQIQSTR